MTDLNLAKQYLTNSIDSLELCGENLENIILISEIIRNSFETGKKLFFCGNGGSAAQSQHLAAEFCGRFLKERPGLPALSLTTDTSAITAIGNDYGYDEVFSRQISALGNANDILIGISTSGKSLNIIKAFEAAKVKDIRTVALVGPETTDLSRIADYTIHCRAKNTNFIQEQQFVLGHMLCYLVEKNMEFTE